MDRRTALRILLSGAGACIAPALAVRSAAADGPVATTASGKVRGAILDSLREMDWAPRRQRRRARQIQEATAAVEQRTHRSATTPEVATELGISVEECQEWMADARTLSVGQLETSTVDDDGRDMIRQIADTNYRSIFSVD